MADSEMYSVEDFEELEKEKDKEGEEKEEVEGEKEEEESEEKEEKEEKDDTPRFSADAGALANMTMEEASKAFATLTAGAQGLAAKARETLTPDEPKAPDPIVADDLLDATTMQSKLDAMVEAKVAPLRQEVTQANAIAVYRNALAVSDVLAMYKPEVDAYAAQLSTEQLADPATWTNLENQLYRTRGAQIQAARTKVKPTPALTETGKSSGEAKKGGKVKLSTEQRFAADQLGVSHKDYAALMPAYGDE